MASIVNTVGKKATPTDRNNRRLVDRGSEIFVDYQSIGTSFKDVVLARDIKGFTAIVLSGTLTLRGHLPVSIAYLDASAFVNAGGGVVTITSTAHGFTIGDSIQLYAPYVATNGHVALTNYTSTYVLRGTGTVDTLDILATYAAFTPTTSYYAIGYRDITYAANESFGYPVAVEAMSPIFVGKGTCTLKIQAWR